VVRFVLDLDLKSKLWDLLSGFDNIVSLTAIYSTRYAAHPKRKLGFATKALYFVLDLSFNDPWCKLSGIW